MGKAKEVSDEIKKLIIKAEGKKKDLQKDF